MTAYPGVACPRCDLRHELGLHKPHRPNCLACGAVLPWANLDHLARRVLGNMECPMVFCIAGFAGLSPDDPEFLAQAAEIQGFLRLGDPVTSEGDPLEYVAAHLDLAAFAALACTLDRWHVSWEGRDNMTLMDLDRRIAEVQGLDDEAPLLELRRLLRELELGALVPLDQ